MQVDDRATLAYYTEPGMMTDPGRYASLLDPLPSDIGGIAKVAQGLLVHEHMAEAYGVTLSDDDRATVHLRPVEQILEAVLARDDRPLGDKRPAADRVAGNCRHFTVLAVAALRAKGTPARARCGFGGYFNDGRFEDHWVCEYWDADQQRWKLADAQLDRHQRAFFPIDFEPTDVPRDRFLVAGDAWSQCRAGQADPDTFGLTFTNEAGYWWIAGNLMRDAAALANVELLPWDGWGVMPGPEDTISVEHQELFDHLALLTESPDTAFDELQDINQTDDRIRVPSVVRNYVLQRDDQLPRA